MRLLVTGGSGFIGTHFLRKAVATGAETVNLDVSAPVSGELVECWRQVDILDRDSLRAVTQEFQPTHVVHLAARTDTDSDRLWDYGINTIGTANLLGALSGLELKRFVFTSSQYVVRPGVLPASDVHFDPHTAYGESKAVGELLTRAYLSEDTWTIVRPTNVWGPWHPRYRTEFWRVVARGLYLHPRGRDARRTYGYVANVVDQMWATLTFPSHTVAGRVFYLGDPPIYLREWTDAFSRALGGRGIRTAPRSLLRVMAHAGDLATALGIRAPLTTERFRNMTEDYVTPVDATDTALRIRRMDLQQGVDETVRWLRGTGSH